MTPEKEVDWQSWYDTFLAKLAETGIVKKACAAARISRQAAYEHRGKNEPFRAAWDEALRVAVSTLEDEGWRRARDGTLKPVFYQGEKCGVIREYSDTMLIFLLKAHKPEVYREQFRHEVTGANGGPIEVSDARERLARLISDHAARSGAGGDSGPTDD